MPRIAQVYMQTQISAVDEFKSNDSADDCVVDEQLESTLDDRSQACSGDIYLPIND